MDQQRYKEIKAAKEAGVFAQICQEAAKINKVQRQELTEELNLDAGPTLEEYEEWQRIKAAVNADK